VFRHTHIVAFFIEIVNQCVWASGAMYNFDWDVGIPHKVKFYHKKNGQRYVEN